jgi:hypothetical protein
MSLQYLLAVGAATADAEARSNPRTDRRETVIEDMTVSLEVSLTMLRKRDSYRQR